MPVPRMVIVAGPPGGGKSSVFSIFKLGLDAFSTDLRAATLLGQAKNLGRPLFQPAKEDVSLYLDFRKQAGGELERFINDHIEQRASFAFETSLRPQTFEQARSASRAGFFVGMTFVAGGDKHEHVERVLERGEPLTIAERAPA